MGSTYVGASGTIPSKEQSNQMSGRSSGAINKRRGPCTSAPSNSTMGGGINRALKPTRQK